MTTKVQETIIKARKILSLESNIIDLQAEIKRLRELYKHIEKVNYVHVQLKEVSENSEFTRKLILNGITLLIATHEKEIKSTENQILNLQL